MTDSIPTTVLKVTHHSAAHIAQRYPYAAYGSNLSFEQMTQRCAKADVITSGRIIGYRFAFARVATIIKEESAQTPVGIYKMTPDDVMHLDRFEGLGRSYDRYLITPFTEDGRAIRCFTYIKRDEIPEEPIESYYQRILMGYRDWHFDDRRLRHARKRAAKDRAAYLLSHKAAHQFTQGVWQSWVSPATTTQGSLFADANDKGEPVVRSLVTDREIKVAKYATANINSVEWGEKNNVLYWRVKGTRLWYRDITAEEDEGTGLVRGEVATNLPGASAYKPVEKQ